MLWRKVESSHAVENEDRCNNEDTIQCSLCELTFRMIINFPVPTPPVISWI